MDGYGYVDKLPDELAQPLNEVLIFHGNTSPDDGAVDGRSHAAPQLAGIRQIVDREIDDRRLIDAWLPHLSKALRLEFYESDWSSSEIEATGQIERARYASEKWTGKR